MQEQITLFDANFQQPTDPQEEYRNIPGFPGYRVGNLGTVWTRWKSIGHGPGGGKGSKAILGDEWRQMNPDRSSSGRLRVILCRDGEQKRFRVHRLVLEAFVGDCPPGMECCHDPDPNPENCRLDNLRWDTRKSNAADRIKHGTSLHGERNGLAKLTEEKVRKIRRLYATGEYTQSALAETFGVNFSNVSQIVLGKTWKHVV